MAGVLHDREVARRRRRQHDRHAHAALHRRGEEPHRLPVGEEVRVLQHDLALRRGDGEVVQPLHRARLSGCRMIRDEHRRRRRRAREPRKVRIAAPCTRPVVTRPVVEKRRLQLADDRPFESRAGVAPAVRMFGIAAPHVVDAVAERVADAAVDHRDLAMVALVVARELAEAHAVIDAEVDAGRAQPRPRWRAMFSSRRADRRARALRSLPSRAPPAPR